MNNHEQALLASALLDPTSIDEVTLSPSDFAAVRHEQIWAVMQRLQTEGLAIDTLSVGDILPEHQVYLFELTSSSYSPASINYYAEHIAETAMRRNLEILGHDLIESVTLPADQVLENARNAFEAISNKENVAQLFSLDELFTEAVDNIGKMPEYIKSPWPLLDNYLGGFRPGALYVIGARPAVGKTVIGLQIAYALAKHGGVSFHSLEMPQREMMNRVMASAGEVRLPNIESGQLTETEWQSLAKLKTTLNGSLFISEKSGQTLADIRKIARAAHKRKPLVAIVIDYLQLMQDTERGRPRYESITAISNGLKSLARDLNVPVIALAQLNRESENAGKENEPQMSHLRDSGAIEQDADVVILLHRVATEGDAEGEKSKMQLLIRKNRQGRTGGVSLLFQGQFARCIEVHR